MQSVRKCKEIVGCKVIVCNLIRGGRLEGGLCTEDFGR